jgi:predicted CoA-substrate-specific enzyme activase
MNYTIGLDIGSRNTKLVVFDPLLHQIIFSEIRETGVSPAKVITALMQTVHDQLSCSPADICKIYTTGYGRNLFAADKKVSEISCHAQGVLYHLPQTRTIIDIGGQDSKVICIGSNGRVKDFAMNDKCAAGTGRYLEMVAIRLGLDISELAEIAVFASHEISLNSVCVVFAETEIVGLIATGTDRSDIVRAVHYSIANRILSQINQLDWEAPLVFTGGVALNTDLKNLISRVSGHPVLTPPHPELTGALGAALIAAHDHISPTITKVLQHADAATHPSSLVEQHADAAKHLTQQDRHPALH